MQSSCRSVPGLWPGLTLVSLGAGLLARELGWLPPGFRVVDFWPLAIVVFGLAQLVQARSAVRAFFGLGFAALGAALLAGNLGFGDFTATRYWPALLILLGLSFLFGGRRKARREHWRERSQRQHFDASSGDGPSGVESAPASEHRLVRSVIFSGTQIRVESQEWTGGELQAVAAGVEIDLRNARLAEAGATLNLDVVMGGVEMRVPDTWQVVCECSPILGGVDDTTRPTQGDSSAPKLRIVGSVTLGGVSIRN